MDNNILPTPDMQYQYQNQTPDTPQTESTIERELPTGEVAKFPANWSEDQIQNSISDFLGREASQSEEIPTTPPEGAAFKQSKPESAWGKFKDDLPAMIGGMAGPLLVAGKASQMSPMAGRALMVGAAGLFGAAGEAWKSVSDSITGAEGAPKSAAEAAARIAKAGGEQAVYEAGGQAVIKGLQMLKKPLQPIVSEATQALGQEFERYGGYMTIPQMAENRLHTVLGGLVEKSFTGSWFFKHAAKRNVKAISRMSDDLANRLVTGAVENLDDKSLGELFVSAVTKGKAAHSEVAGQMFKQIDNLVGQRELTTTMQKMHNSGIRDVTGKPIESAVEETVTRLVDNAPVDVRPLKKLAQEQLAKIERTGNLAGEENTKILQTMASRPDTMLFSDANTIRSDLLAVGRELKDKMGADRAKRTAGEFADAMTNALERAATDSGDPAIMEAYKKANTFWRKGKETFNNKLVSKLLSRDKTTLERIGDTIFTNGNVTEVHVVKKAIRTAALLDKSVNYQQVWGNMQAGYVRKLISESLGPNEVVSHTKLASLFTNPKKYRTLKAVFTPEQRKRLHMFQQITERSFRKPESNLSMVIQLSQASTLAGLATFKVIDPSTAVTFTIAPAVLARMLTNPETSRQLIRGMGTKITTSVGKQLATKLAAEAAKLASDDGGSSEYGR